MSAPLSPPERLAGIGPPAEVHPSEPHQPRNLHGNPPLPNILDRRRTNRWHDRIPHEAPFGEHNEQIRQRRMNQIEPHVRNELLSSLVVLHEPKQKRPGVPSQSRPE